MYAKKAFGCVPDDPRSVIRCANRAFEWASGMAHFSMVVEMVPLKGGRWHIIPQLAVYTTYIPPIYCPLGGYIQPLNFSYYQNRIATMWGWFAPKQLDCDLFWTCLVGKWWLFPVFTSMAPSWKINHYFQVCMFLQYTSTKGSNLQPASSLLECVKVRNSMKFSQSQGNSASPRPGSSMREARGV